jgi:ubiquitin-large subunit ribosomal protein L40e
VREVVQAPQCSAAEEVEYAPRREWARDGRDLSIYVKDMNGKSTQYDVQAEDTALDLMHDVQGSEGIPISQQRLIFGGKQCELHKRLDSYGVYHGCTVMLVLRLRGC